MDGVKQKRIVLSACAVVLIGAGLFAAAGIPRPSGIFGFALRSPAAAGDSRARLAQDLSGDPGSAGDTDDELVLVALPLVFEGQKRAEDAASPADKPRSDEPRWVDLSRSLLLYGSGYMSGFGRGLVSNLFCLNSVSVRGNYRLSADEIVKSSGLIMGEWFWNNSPVTIEQRLSRSAWIDRAEASWQFYPLRLLVAVHETEPWLVAELNGQSWLVSRRGTLIQPLEGIDDPELIVEASELKRLNGLEPGAAGPSYLSSATTRFDYAVKALSLIEMAGDVPFSVSSFTLLDDGSIAASPVEQDRFPEVLLRASTLAETREALGRLGKVLSDLNSRGERSKRIELRFANQAVVE